MPNRLKSASILACLPHDVARYEVRKIEELKSFSPTPDRMVEIEAAIANGPETAKWRAWLNEAIEGDANDAMGFVFRLPNPFRGWLALGAYHAGVPNPVYRTIIASVWEHDHNVLMATVKHRRSTIRAMMRRAAFDVSGLPETFPIYRGVADLPRAKAAKGLAWTTSYNVAAWFAVRASRRPLVLKAQAKRSEILFHHNERNEQEVILSRDLTTAETAIVDGPAEWVARHEDHVTGNNAREREWRAEIEARVTA